jgi:hypothetical protein
MNTPFYLKDCALSVISTGESASSLMQLREKLFTIPLNSIYYHFWGVRLRSSFHHPEYHNDFARWANSHLRDSILCERLSIIDATAYKDLEELRHVLIDIMEDRLDELEFILWKKGSKSFYFLRSSIVIFDSGLVAHHPPELKNIIPALPLSSIFYHFIDARNRTKERIDDFSSWLMGFSEEASPLVQKIQHIDPYFLSLSEIKQKLMDVVNEHFT